MKYEHGDRKLFGTYWSIHGPVRIELEDYIYDADLDMWVIARSPDGVKLVKATVKPWEA